MSLAEKFKASFYYDETSPTFLRWAVYGPGWKKDSVAGCVVRKKDGRFVVHVSLHRKLYQGHRVVWTLFNGDIPDHLEIDHEDGNSVNNRPTNLRAVTHSVNKRNSRMLKNNTSGKTGVGRYKDRETFIWKASWVDESGKLCSKAFSESTYGSSEARDLAFKVRDEEIAKLQHYTERHGI